MLTLKANTEESKKKLSNSYNRAVSILAKSNKSKIK